MWELGDGGGVAVGAGGEDAVGGACAAAISANAKRAINREAIFIRMKRQRMAAADVPQHDQDFR